MTRRIGPKGFTAFLLIWGGQSVSLIGSSLTGFALGVWVYPRVRHVDTELPDFTDSGRSLEPRGAQTRRHR